MNDANGEVPWVDGALFNENANKIPAEEQLRYSGKRVAYSPDGTKIVASGKDYDELFAALKAAGIDTSRVVLSYIPGEDEDPIILCVCSIVIRRCHAAMQSCRSAAASCARVPSYKLL